MAHNYDVGTRAWQPDPTDGWVASEVESKKVEGQQVKLVFQLANGEVYISGPPLLGVVRIPVPDRHLVTHNRDDSGIAARRC